MLRNGKMIANDPYRRLLCIILLFIVAVLILFVPRWYMDERSWLVPAPVPLHLSLVPGVQSRSSSSSRGDVIIIPKELPRGVENVRLVLQDALCPFSDETRNPKMIPLSNVRIAAIGDSITYGNGSHTRKPPKGGGNFPMTLQRLLDQRVAASVRAHHPRIVVRNFGVNGATATDSSSSKKNKKFSYRRHQEFRDAVRFRPHVIFIMLGTNDAKSTIFAKQYGAQNFQRDLFSIANSLVAGFLDTREMRRKRNAKLGNPDAVPDVADSTVPGSRDDEENFHFSPLIFFVTPPPLASRTKATQEWSFVPSLLQRQIVPAIRDIVNSTIGVRLIDLNEFFVSEPQQWTCPPASSSSSSRKKKKKGGGTDEENDEKEDAQDGDDDHPKQGEKHSSSVVGEDKVSRYQCMYRDGVHPKRLIHDLIGQKLFDGLLKGLC